MDYGFFSVSDMTLA